MKRLILGHAFHRDVAREHLRENAKPIRDHIIKCVVYKDSRPDDVHKWIHKELAVWLSDASTVQCRSKLKVSDYLDMVFGELGDEPVDCRVILKSFRRKYCSPSDDPYPEFEITPKLVDTMYDYCNLIKSKTLPLLMRKGGATALEFAAILDTILL